MIYVRRDSSLIPEKLLKVAERAQQKLEALPADERPAFIKKKSHVWRAFARYLSKMSYGKCWYSESLDPQSFFDVDHYRPKLEARRSDDVTDPGYEWLAFSWENFRLSAQRSNRVSKNEETDENEGKGNWFPLLETSPKACWENRCEDTEQPVLLDPVKKADVRLIDVQDDGRMGPSRICIGSARLRVERSIELYGLNLPAPQGSETQSDAGGERASLGPFPRCWRPRRRPQLSRMGCLSISWLSRSNRRHFRAVLTRRRHVHS